MQDDVDDWTEQAGQMAHIYAQSLITIAAEDAPDPTTEVLNRLYSRAPWMPLPSYENIFLRRSLEQSRFGRTRYDNLLGKRAWTYQETQLSPRLVRLSKQHIAWECCEKGHTHDQHEHSLIGPNASLNRLCSRRSLETDEEVHDLWIELVQEYTNRQLTMAGDKMAAFAAIGKKFNDLFRAGGSYCMGLWSDWLLHDLEWLREGDSGEGDCRHSRDREHLSLLPSWSWVKTCGRIKMNRMHQIHQRDGVTSLETVASIIDTVFRYRGSPYLGLASKATLSIEAPYLKVKAQARLIEAKSFGLRFIRLEQIELQNPPRAAYNGNMLLWSKIIEKVQVHFDVDHEAPHRSIVNPARECDSVIIVLSIRNNFCLTGLWLRRLREAKLTSYARIAYCSIECRRFHEVDLPSTENEKESQNSFVRASASTIAKRGFSLASRHASADQISAERKRREEWDGDILARNLRTKAYLRELVQSLPRQRFAID